MTSLTVCCLLTKDSGTNSLTHVVKNACATAGPANSDQPVSLVAEADCIIFCSLVYVYDLSATAKNFVKLTGRGPAWFKKSVGFACMAGTVVSFILVMPFANGLMFDYKRVIVPQFAYVTGTAFDSNEVGSPNIQQCITNLTTDVERLGAASQTLSDW